MNDSNRKFGIEIVGEVPWGSHLCQFYQAKEDLLDILVPYFKAGLENNEFCMWVTSEPLKVEDAKRSLRKVVEDLDDYIEKGQIEILDYSQWYTKSGKFEADKVLEGWVEKENQAIKRGFDGLRLTGNTFWLAKEIWEKFAAYEAAVNNVIGKYRIIAICTYSLDKCGASEIIDVVSSHQSAFIRREGKWELIESAERKQAEEVEKKRVAELEKAYRELERAQDASLNIMEDMDERRKELDTALRKLQESEAELQKAYQELKETYIQLTQANKLTAMGEMAAGVVHELTQPLFGIKGFTTALLEDMKRNLPTETSQQAIADIDVILQQTDRMMKILNMIREFARASGTEISPLDINKPIEDALLLFSEQLRLHNTVVEKNLAWDLPPVMGNANQLQQVFINLIANARDAIDAKGGEGRLIVSTEMSPADASILIEVIDNGTGADAETLSKMFDPFFTTTKPGDGVGLGLAIVARIVKDHKGTIDVQSKPGEGCKFSIRLPH